MHAPVGKLLIICVGFLSYSCNSVPFQVLGGIEPSLYKGDIWYTPIKEEWYYQIEILKLEIGGQSLNLDCREVCPVSLSLLSWWAWVLRCHS